eukprot:m51a1_g13688 hypothetical protein (119) ;mRNA; r:1127-1792
MGMLDYTFNQVRYLLSMSDLWPKNQDLISTTLLLHIVEHLRLNPTYQPRSLILILDNPVNQNKNNVTVGYSREFLRSFRVQVSDLKHCYLLANYFETCLINYSSLADLYSFYVYKVIQ